MTKTMKVGIIGCGNISGAYLKHCKQFPILDVVACADLDVSRAQARADEFGVPKACSVDELLRDPDIELVINLTIPAVHGQVSEQALNHGKHVYVEKPLAIAKDEGKHVLRLAQEKGLRIGAAPDTVLGAGLQTCRKLIDDGAIGTPLSAVAFMMGKGHESWHPDPAFYYKVGGGPLFDMGPYYLSALIQLLGPIREVSAVAKTTFTERTITSQPKYGEVIQVETPTHLSGNLTFAGGALATMIMSFDVFGGHRLPHIEVYGSEGTLCVPDPNRFDGEVLLRSKGSKDWETIPHSHAYSDSGRGLGVAEMAHAIRLRKSHRANGEIAYHVLETMHAFHESAEMRKTVSLTSTCTRPEMMPQNGL